MTNTATTKKNYGKIDRLATIVKEATIGNMTVRKGITVGGDFVTTVQYARRKPVVVELHDSHDLMTSSWTIWNIRLVDIEDNCVNMKVRSPRTGRMTTIYDEKWKQTV